MADIQKTALQSRFFFFCIPQLYGSVSLGFTILGKVFAYVTVLQSKQNA